MDTENLVLKKIFADMTDDIASAIVLAEVVKYYTDDLEFEAEKDDLLWIVKSPIEWWENCRLHTDQVHSAILNLVKASLLVTKVYKYEHAYVRHIRLNIGKFLQVLKEAEERTKINAHLFE